MHTCTYNKNFYTNIAAKQICIDWCQQCITTQYTILQHTATHGNTLPRTTTHCNTLTHTATHTHPLQHLSTTKCQSLMHTHNHTPKLIISTYTQNTFQPHARAHAHTLTKNHSLTCTHTQASSSTSFLLHKTALYAFGTLNESCQSHIWAGVTLMHQSIHSGQDICGCKPATNSSP